MNISWTVTYRLKATNINVKDHIGQGQIRIPKKGRWAHNNVKLLRLLDRTVVDIPVINMSLTTSISIKNFLTSIYSFEKSFYN